MVMPVGGTEVYLNRQEAQYLDEVLAVFGIKEIQASLSLVNLPIPDRTGNLYGFMAMNITLKNMMRNAQEKGGAIWLMPKAIEHLVAAVSMFDPDGMPSELVSTHISCSSKVLDRLLPKATLLSSLVNRWEESPLTTKSTKSD